MEWFKELEDLCNEKNLEAGIARDGYLVIIGSKDIPATLQQKIRKLLPEGTQCRFTTGMKSSTYVAISLLLLERGVFQRNIRPQDTELIVEAWGIRPDSDVWVKVAEVVAGDGYLTSWKKVLHSIPAKPLVDIAVEHVKNQEDGKYIRPDDIMNLKITLGTANTVEELLEAL